MAWGRKNTGAQKPAWSQDDYHAAFAGKLKEQIEQGVAPWQKTVEARRGTTPEKHPDQQAVPGRQFGLPQRDPNREGLQR